MVGRWRCDAYIVRSRALSSCTKGCEWVRSVATPCFGSPGWAVARSPPLSGAVSSADNPVSVVAFEKLSFDGAVMRTPAELEGLLVAVDRNPVGRCPRPRSTSLQSSDEPESVSS